MCTKFEETLYCQENMSPKIKIGTEKKKQKQKHNTSNNQLVGGYNPFEKY